jgi:predicted transcriptional regulator
MPKPRAIASVSFRAPQHQIKRLDLLAKRQRRDRTQLIGEAIEQYLELQDVHLAQIREGIEADDRGDYASEQEVEAEFARWRKL